GPVYEESRFVERISPSAGEREIVRALLTGAADFAFEADRVRILIQDRFFHLELDDPTHLMDTALLERYKDETSSAGAFVRRTLSRLAQATSTEEKETATLALR